MELLHLWARRTSPCKLTDCLFRRRIFINAIRLRPRASALAACRTTLHPSRRSRKMSLFSTAVIHTSGSMCQVIVRGTISLVTIQHRNLLLLHPNQHLLLPKKHLLHQSRTPTKVRFHSRPLNGTFSSSRWSARTTAVNAAASYASTFSRRRRKSQRLRRR